MHECLPQNKLGSSSDHRGFAQQSHCPYISGVSLSQLMSQHVQKSKDEGDNGRSFGLPSLSALTKGSISPPSVMCNQNSLSLGTLASLNMSSGSQSSAPSLLSVPLSNLSLNTSTTKTSSLQAPSGFSLSSLLSTTGSQSSPGAGGQTKTASSTGSPSLSDLIQEHSNCSSNAKTATPPAQTLSLSELAAQHRGKNTHTPLGIPAPPLSSTVTPVSFGEAVSVTDLALRNQANSHLTESGTFIEPYTSSTAPFAPAGSPTEGVKNHKPSHRNPRSSKPRLTIDIGALMEQSEDTSYFSEVLSSFPRTASVFAKPSVFACALLFQSQRLQRRNLLKKRVQDQGTGSDHQDLSSDPPEPCPPPSPITPFLFDIPSPDDIIRANQRKAFTR